MENPEKNVCGLRTYNIFYMFLGPSENNDELDNPDKNTLKSNNCNIML